MIKVNPFYFTHLGWLHGDEVKRTPFSLKLTNGWNLSICKDVKKYFWQGGLWKEMYMSVAKSRAVLEKE